MASQKQKWIVFAAVVALFAFFSTSAWAQNGAHLDVEPEQTYGETGESAQSDEPVQGAETRETTVRQVERVEYNQPTWAGVLARNAIAGGVTGGLIGLGVWLLTDMAFSWMRVAQFAGGGILVGAVIGVVELAARPDVYALEPPSSLVWVTQDAPRTMMVPMLTIEY